MKILWWEDPLGAFVRWGVSSLRLRDGRISWTRVVASLLLIGFAIGTLTASAMATRAEERRILEVMRDQQEALNNWKRAKKLRQQHIEGLSDRRAEGRFTADQSREGLRLAERISEKFPTLDDWAVDEAVAFLFGTGATKDEIAHAAYLVHTDRLEFDPQVSAERRARRVLEPAVKRNGR